MRRFAGAAFLAASAGCVHASPAPGTEKHPLPASVERPQPIRPFSVTTLIDVPAMAAPRWTPFQRDSAIAILSYHRARWSMSRPREYRYWEATTCFCFRFSISPRIVTVSDGRVTGATDTTGRRTDAAFVRAGSQRWAGIDALFDRLAAGIRDSAYAVVTVEYDTLRGYPMRAVFDRDLFTNDDELHIVINHFEVLH